MRNLLFAFAASSLALSSASFAASSIECSNADGFQVSLNVSDAGSLGTLTYGTAGELNSIEGVETSLSQGLGAAVKGSEVLFVVSPAQNGKLGELVLDGTTYRVSCK